MLIIPFSIRKNELKKVEKYFSETDFIKIAQKVKKGLGILIKQTKEGNIVKLRTTINGVAGRSIFFLITDTNDVFPIILRLKKDPIGKNMTFKSKEFVDAFYKNYHLIEQDFENDDFDIIEI